MDLILIRLIYLQDDQVEKAELDKLSSICREKKNKMDELSQKLHFDPDNSNILAVNQYFITYYKSNYRKKIQYH